MVSVEKRFHDIRTKLFLETKWFGVALLKLGDPIILTSDNPLARRIPTLCVNSKNLYINEDFVNTLTDEEFAFTLLHEVYHVMFRHLHRSGDLKVKDFQTFNEAADYIVNFHLYNDLQSEHNAERLCTLPWHALVLRDSLGNMVDLSDVTTEQLFQQLLEQQQQQLAEAQASIEMPGSLVDSSADNEDDDGSGSASDDEENDGSEQGSSANEEANDSESTEDDSSGEFNGNDSDESDDSESTEDDNSSESNGNDSDESDEEESGQDEHGDEESDASSAGSEGDPTDYDFNDLFTPVSNDIDSDNVESFAMDTFAESLIKSYSEVCGGGAMRELSSLFKPEKIRWDKYLRRFLSQHTELEDSSFQTPDRHYLPYDLVMPGPCAVDKFNNVGLFLDTSGSMSQEDVDYFLRTALSLCTNYKCTVSLYLWTTTVYKEYRDLTEQDIPKLYKTIDLHSGGTDYSNVAEYIQKNCKNDVCYCVFTDGCFNTRFNVPKKIQRKTIFILKDTDGSDGLDHLGKVVKFKR